MRQRWEPATALETCGGAGAYMVTAIALVVIICAFTLLFRMNPSVLTLRVWRLFELRAEARDSEPPARLPRAKDPKALPPPQDQEDAA